MRLFGGGRETRVADAVGDAEEGDLAVGTGRGDDAGEEFGGPATATEHGEAAGVGDVAADVVGAAGKEAANALAASRARSDEHCTAGISGHALTSILYRL